MADLETCGDGREDLEAERRDAIQTSDGWLVYAKPPAPEDLETRADHATGVLPPA